MCVGGVDEGLLRRRFCEGLIGVPGVPGGVPVAAVEPKPVCVECGRVYSSVSNLKQHMANVHSASPNWEPCPVCGKHFKTRQYLFNHLLQTHGIRQRANRMMPSYQQMISQPIITMTTSNSSIPQRVMEQCLDLLSPPPPPPPPPASKAGSE